MMTGGVHRQKYHLYNFHFASGAAHSLIFNGTHSVGMSFITILKMFMCAHLRSYCPGYSLCRNHHEAHIVFSVLKWLEVPGPHRPLKGNPFHSSVSSSSPLVPLLQRWKQWTVEARKKLVMMATTDTEMPEKMMMSRSVRVRVAWHSRKLSFDSWVNETRLPSMGREHSMPSTPE